MKLDQLLPGTVVRGIIPDAQITVVSVQWFGCETLEITYKTAAGKVANKTSPWSFSNTSTTKTTDFAELLPRAEAPR